MRYGVIFIILCFVLKGYSQLKWSSQDRDIFNSYIKNIELQKEEDRCSYTISYFFNTPYVSHSLEVNKEEKLVINFHGLDCVTYVETVLALLQVANKKNPSFEFENNLKKIRYREGQINGYLSRLHYFIDWIQDNEKKGLVKNITPLIDSTICKINIFAMSVDTQNILLKKYPQYVDSMRKIEANLNRQIFYYIPIKKIEKHLSKIKTGDIIAFTTSLPGLDIAHVGFALWKEDSLYIVHASSTQRKVAFNKLLPYLLAVKHFTGIMIVRQTIPKN